MRRMLIPICLFLALGAVEGLAYWWMHPAPTGHSEPILAYRPQAGLDGTAAPLVPSNMESGRKDQEKANAQPTPSTTPLPDLYRQAAPMLRCTSGQVFHIALDEIDRTGLHAAWFEWDGTDTGSVLEAFRHPPDACMGSLGMILVSKEKPIPYTVKVKKAGDRRPETRYRSSEDPVQQSSTLTDIRLYFDHSIFREPGASAKPFSVAPPIHTFRAVWVAGMPAVDPRGGIHGHGMDHLRTIRLRSALNRQRPSHARVIQGSVRGYHSTAEAWNAFEQSVLRHLTVVHKAE